MSTDEVLSASHSLSISIKINEAHDCIELDLMGPSDSYYAVGFGSKVMVNTWTVVVNGEGDDGWFEQTLSNHRPGLQRKLKSFEMIENTFTAQTLSRRLHLKQSLTALKAYHPFNIDDDKIDVIWAIGTDETFSFHIDYGTKALYYEIDGISDQDSPPHDVTIYFGDMNLSALIVVIGMLFLCTILGCYWLWKFCKYLRQRAEEREHEEKKPLLDNISYGSNNRFIVL